MDKVLKYFSPQVIEKIGAEIEGANGNEVFFVGYTEEDLIVYDIKVVARGHKTAVPAILKIAENADVVIHNHPSGDLTPSEADLNIASHLDRFSVAFYIVNNDASDIYVAVEPFAKKDIKPIDVAEIEQQLKPDGPIAQNLNGYEDRPMQIEMIDAVSSAFNSDKICLVEAGTGTGKTMAYLLPAIYWAVQNEERVVISTNTINLQEQLIKKDIPFLQKVLDKKFDAVLVKGRGNYACLRKIDEIEQDFTSFAEDDDPDELKHLIGWARNSRDGSKADLSMIPKDTVWEKMAAESDTCTRSKCKHFRACFVNKARRRASRAQILVSNHHLLFADLAIRHHIGSTATTAVLPPYHRIIFDEAHHIEDVATNYFGVSITRGGITRILNRLHRKKKALPKGQLHSLYFRLMRKKGQIDPDLFEEISQKLNGHLVNLVESTFHITNEVMDQLYDVIRSRFEKNEERESKIRLLPHVYDQLFLGSGLEETFKDYILSLKNLSASIFGFLTMLKKAEKELSEDFVNLTIEVQAQAERIAEAAEAINQVVFEDNEEHIRWIEIKKGYKSRNIVRFKSSPLDISEMMDQTVYEPFGTVIMTSATLTVDQKFDFLEKRIGLEKLKNERKLNVQLVSPFDYSKQVLLTVPLDIPEPAHPKFTEELTKNIFKALTISEGRAFVLFTSYGLLHVIFNQLKESLNMLGITVLRQGAENRHDLLKKFRKDKTSVLFATDSFWEGVDVVGEALENVIITKLPFKVPNEPIIEARYESIEKNGGNPFMEYAVPLAVLKFKQGFGRLIRHKTDRGSVIIFDKRVVEKAYGKRFLRSLPACKTVIGNKEEVFSALKDFF